MSVKTFVPDEKALAESTNKDFKTKFFPLVKKLAKKHTSPETAAPCFVHTAYKFKDGEGYLALFGKMAKFKKFAKETAAKEDAARGYCFVSTDDKGGLVFNFMPVAGKFKAKEAQIAKAQKSVVSVSKLGFVLAKGEFADNDALDAATENMPETPDEPADAVEAGAEDAPQATEAAPQATEAAPQATEAAPQATQTAAPEVTPAAKAVLGKIGSFSAHIAAASKQFGIPESQIKAIIATESAGVPTANSSSKPESGGAAGLMQVTSGTWPDTCKQFPELAKYNDYFKYRYDPLANIMVGTATLKLKAKVTGVAVDDPNFATVAVTAYNAGEGIVKKAMEFAKAGGSQNPAADFTKPEFLKKAIQAYPSVYNYYMPGQGGGKNNKSGSVAEAIELKYKEISKYGPKVSMYLEGAKAEAGEATNTTPANPAQPDGAEAQAKAKAMTLLQDIFKLYQELAKTPA
jgi:soluble lytic murein transglycosylase-like protein